MLAGGGNTSCKIDDLLYVKGSGTALATMTRDGFVKMDRKQLSELANATLDADPKTREAQFKDAINRARCEPEKGQRPSVEVLLHHLVPARYVVHSHATIANTLTCHTGGQALAEQIFGDDIVWVPYVDPGFILAQTLKQALEDYRARTGRELAKAILMANHGLIVAGDDPSAIRANTDEILQKIAARLGDDWQTKLDRQSHARRRRQRVRAKDRSRACALCWPKIPPGPLKVVTFDDSDIALGLIGTEAGQAMACAGPMTPDQIVYCNSFPLWFKPKDGEDEDALIARLRGAIDQHIRETRVPPKVVLVQGVGLFGVGDDFKMANTVREVYLDAIKVMAGATRLGGGSGGVSYLTDRQRLFIENWEVEAYRKKVAAASAAAAGRLKGKVAIVTGAAQGFGLEIAQSLAAEGAHVVLTDVNGEGAAAAAHDLCQVHGIGRAISLPINVTDGGSIAECIDQVVRTYGGFDLFISNAGVLKAESVKTQSEKDFGFVTDVNYKGYFLCVQKAAPILATQHKAKPGYTERHHPDQFQVGPCRFQPQRGVRGQQVRRDWPDPVVRAGTGGRRHQGQFHLPRQFLRRPVVVRPGKRLVRPVPASRQGAGRENHRGRAPRLRSQSADRPRLHDGGRDEGDLLSGRAAVRNRSGLARDGWAGYVELKIEPRSSAVRNTGCQ